MYFEIKDSAYITLSHSTAYNIVNSKYTVYTDLNVMHCRNKPVPEETYTSTIRDLYKYNLNFEEKNNAYSMDDRVTHLTVTEFAWSPLAPAHQIQEFLFSKKLGLPTGEFYGKKDCLSIYQNNFARTKFTYEWTILNIINIISCHYKKDLVTESFCSMKQCNY